MSHPLLRAGPLTTAVILRILAADGVVERDLATRGRVTRAPTDPGGDTASVPGLRVRVPTPQLGAGETVFSAIVGGVEYVPLDSEQSAPALGSRVDWQSTTYQLRNSA